MTFFLAECSVSNLTLYQIRTLLQSAAQISEQITGPGIVGRYMRSVYVPGDDRLFCLSSASDVTLVRDVNEAAQLPFTRIVEALEFTQVHFLQELKMFTKRFISPMELFSVPHSISNSGRGDTPPLGPHNLLLSLFHMLLTFTLRRSVKRPARGILILLIAMTALGLGQVKPAFAAGIVGNGAPASCTEAAFDSVLASQVEQIKFNCGPAVKTIVLTTTKTLSWTTIINGGNKIILQAKNVRHFNMLGTNFYTLKNITLKDGKADYGGAINNNGALALQKVKLDNNKATVDGGAIQNTGSITINKSTFTSNRAKARGGAIYNYGGSITITNSVFTQNTATDKNDSLGGAIYSESGNLILEGGSFTKNTAAMGSALAINLGQVTLKGTKFTENTAAQFGTLYIAADQALLQDTLVDRHRAFSASGVASLKNLTIKNSIISNNVADFLGGGIAVGSDNDDNFVMENSTVTGNRAGLGAGMFLGRPFEIKYSTISNNRASQDGAGAWVISNGFITKSTISNNRSTGYAGGVFAYAPGFVLNSTLSSNQAKEEGGAWYQIANSTGFTFVTIANNQAKRGGGIVLSREVSRAQRTSPFRFIHPDRGELNPSAPVDDNSTHLQNTLLAKNSGGNCRSVNSDISTQNYNLSDDATCENYLTGTNDWNKTPAKLGPLDDNGGNTFTHLPQKGSKAIDGGIDIYLYQIDQRGYTRPYKSTSDIGAV